jgi:predicted metal-dependent hydrolase
MFFIKRIRRVVRTYNSLKGPQKEYLLCKETARVLVKRQLEFFNELYKFQYKRISIKNQRARWGSCSKTGNLNFHYKIVLLPANLSNYIIVHELCHLKQFDHSKNFWDLVSKTIPDYKELRKKLKDSSFVLNLKQENSAHELT